MKKTKIHKMTLCALFAALTAVLSQIVIPIGPVPINLATFIVFCAGALLGSRLGALSLTIWAALGTAGIPVFAMFRSGLGALAGPTGGYIIGYIPAAFIIGLLIEKLNKKSNKLYMYPITMIAGMCVFFTLGTVWYIYSTESGLWNALTICVIPFLPGEFIKITAASLLSKRLRPSLHIKNGNKVSAIA